MNVNATATAAAPETFSARNERGRPTATDTLSTRRLNVMRFGYAFMGVGVAIVKWPILIEDARSIPVMDGVVVCLLTAVSILAFLGLRYPVKVLPILVFEVLWKVLWLGAVGVPRLVAQDTNAELQDVLFSCSFVIVIIAVIPWRYVIEQLLASPGDRWRSG